MPDLPDLDDLGPVDVALVLFEGNQFNGDIAPALAELQQAGIVHIIDLAFITKDADGQTAILEVVDSGVAEAFASLDDDHLDLLNDEDLEAMAEGLPENSSALAVVWENSWAARLGAALRGSGGQMVAQIRVPRETVGAALDALREE